LSGKRPTTEEIDNFLEVVFAFEKFNDSAFLANISGAVEYRFMPMEHYFKVFDWLKDLPSK